MLQRVRFQNYARFKDESDLKFATGGVHLLVGEAGIGMSSVLEAVSKCLQTNDFGRVPSRFSETSQSIVVCEFLQENKFTCSGYINLCKHEKCPTLKCNLLKFLVVKPQGGGVHVHILRWGPIGTTWLYYRFEPDSKQKKCLNELSDKTLESIIEQFEFYSSKIEVNRISGTKDFFDKLVDENCCVLMTLPHRGLHLSQSLMGGTDRSLASSLHADVFRWYMRNGNGKEPELFEQMTNSDYEMVIQDKELVMRAGATNTPLLQLPESVLEGKLISILLSHTKANTVCLEEPQKGMDVQTKLRLRDHVLKQVDETKSKLVLVATHDPFLITDWNLKNCHFFREKNDKSCTLKNKTLLSLFPKGQRYITNHPINHMFVSKRSIFVEGISDFLFIERMKDVFLQYPNITQDLLQKCGIGDRMREFRRFLTSLTVITMGSKWEVEKIEQVCQELEMDKTDHRPATRFFLVDKDAYSIIKENVRTSVKIHDFEDLAKAGVFVWDTDLEGEVVKFVEQKNMLQMLDSNGVKTVRIGEDGNVVKEGGKVQLRKSSMKKKNGKVLNGKLFLENRELTEKNMIDVVKNLISEINLNPDEGGGDSNFGTVPRFVRFLLNQVRDSISSDGDTLQWCRPLANQLTTNP